MALYSGGLIIGLIFPERVYFCFMFLLFSFIFFYFFCSGEVGEGGEGLIIGLLQHVTFNEKSFRPLGIREPVSRSSRKVFGHGKP